MHPDTALTRAALAGTAPATGTARATRAAPAPLAGLALLLLGLSAAHAEGLPRTVAEADRHEAANALPRTPFYDTDALPAGGPPGELLRHEDAAGYALPPGARAVRILYRSRSAADHDVVSSALVLVPRGEPPQGGWPVIAWAHGTTGVARECAPSLQKDLGEYAPHVIAPMLAAGFAVVATDYHGLGTAGPHEYVNKSAQARDVIYSIPAARAAVPALGRHWVVDGHSQGGLTAWSVAEMEHALHDADFLGAVSVAGVARESDFFHHLDTTAGVGFYLAYMAYAIQVRSPQFEPRQLLSDAALERFPAATSHGCWYHAFATYRDMQPGTLLRPDAAQNRWVHAFFAGNTLGAAPVSAPLLVLAGEADTTVPLPAVREAAERACRAGTRLAFKSYPGLDHDPTMYDTLPEQLDWIRARFAGRPFSPECPAAAAPSRRSGTR